MKSRADYLAEYGTDYRIRQKVDAGELFEVGKAVYSEVEDVPEIAVVLFRHPNAVVTMRSAFYMHGLTDVIPDEYDLATDRNAAKIRDKRVRQYFYPSDFFDQGTELIKYKGFTIPVYNRERMLIELLRYKSKLPFDYYKEILLNYRAALPQLDMQAVQDYAWDAPRSRKIMETLQMEVL
ncbi:MAG: hypothetical protein J6Z23_06790 [Lachnospiraceae bacterium]|nr:hypothetical protein [Lachnospiraceae bacterium]